MDDDDLFDRPSGPLTWQSLGGIFLYGISGALEEIGGIFEGLGRAFLGAHNYEIERRQFHEQAALELEALTREIAE